MTAPTAVPLQPATNSPPASPTTEPHGLRAELHEPRPLPDGSDAHRRSPGDRKLLLINLAAVLVPFAGLILATALTWGDWFDWTQASIFVGMLVFTSLGVTVGYHRLATHSSFQTFGVVRFILTALGSMAAQGPVIEWAGTHRRHHQHSDDHDDPHSPHQGGRGSWRRGVGATIRGLYHAHMGWLFSGRLRGLGRYTRDLHADRVLCAVNRQFPWWVLAGLAVPAVLAGLITMSFTGAALGLLWGGLVRMFVAHHITWSVNSVCHLWGTSPFRSPDHSRNNALIALLAFGEGWHNNHHAFPTSARHGLRWWEIDGSYVVIRLLEVVGLAWRVRIPSPEQVVAKRR